MVLDRIAAASPQATSLQLRVLATRLQLSLHREGKRLPPEYSEWNPWEFDFSHGWRLAAADAAWALEPHLSKNRLPEWIGILDINGTLDASERGLVLIPESISELIVANGHLKLSRTLIAHLPEDFYTVTVDWDLRLEGNRITRLPQALGHLQVGGSLRLSHNRISCLPETLGHLRVGRDLRLSHNQIQSLPASVGRLDIRGTLALQRNNLVSLPPRDWQPLRRQRSAPRPQPHCAPPGGDCPDSHRGKPLGRGQSPAGSPPASNRSRRTLRTVRVVGTR